MGKLRFKLSHVMPHVWFYKLKEIGRTGNRLASNHHLRSRCHHRIPSARPAKAGLIDRSPSSPVNHKAVDVTFYEASRRHGSVSHNQAVMDKEKRRQIKDISSVCTIVDSSFSAACTCRTTVGASHPKGKQGTAQAWSSGDASEWPEGEGSRGSLLRCSRNVEDSTEFGFVQDSKAAPKSSKSSAGTINCFDARELEYRLKTLWFDGRKKYYSSPEFSAAMPSPLLNGESQESLDLLDYSYGNSLGEDEKSAVQQSFEARSSNASSLSLSTSSLGDGFEVRTRSISGKDLSPIIHAKASLFATVDEIGDPLVRKFSALKKMPYVEVSDLADKITTRNKVRSIVDTGGRKKYYDLKSRLRGSFKYARLEDKQSSASHINGGGIYDAKREIQNGFCYDESKKRLLSGKLHEIQELSDSEQNERNRIHHSRKRNRHHAIRHRGSRPPRSIRHPQRKADNPPEVIKDEAQSGYFDHYNNLKERLSSRARSSYDRKAQAMIREGLHLGGVQEASWYKGTLRLVKETRERKGLQEFSSQVQSKVFDSFAMVKCSYDPRQDFKDSMMEMILEKKLRSSEDLEELLQCYLSLNSEQYHDTIFAVFREISSQISSD